MKNKILKQLYIPKCEIEKFRGKIEKLMVALSGSKKVDFATRLDDYEKEEVIIFDAIFYGDTEEEAIKECEKFKELIKASFGEEPKEK